MSNEPGLFTPDELSLVRTREATLTQRATQLIENLIVERRLQPGDRLPSVRDLAEQFGVSRTVIREAVGALVAKSLLEVRHGSGITVRSPTAQSVAQSMSLFLRGGHAQPPYQKIIEVRRTLEVAIAGLAAERRSDADLGELQALLDEMAGLDEGERFVRNDVAFHATLARATHNELYVMLLDSIADLLVQARRLALAVPDGRAGAQKHHPAIFGQVEAGNAEGAREAMRAHLAEAEATMSQALALKSNLAESSDKGAA